MEEGEFILRIARSTAHYLQVIPSVLDTINSSKHKSTLDWFNLYYRDRLQSNVILIPWSDVFSMMHQSVNTKPNKKSGFFGEVSFYNVGISTKYGILWYLTRRDLHSFPDPPPPLQGVF